MDLKLMFLIIVGVSSIFGFGMIIGYYHAVNSYFKEDPEAPEPPDKCTCTYPQFCDKFCSTKTDHP